MDSREAMAYAHLSHLTSQAAYYKLDDCYSPLDIRTKFPNASPHTAVSFSSSSSRHESPEGDEPSSSDITSETKWPMESAPATIAIPGSLLYTSTSASSTAESPVSSVRSDPEDAQPDESTQSRRKGRKQFKPLRCKTDRDMVAEQICPDVTSADSQSGASVGVEEHEPLQGPTQSEQEEEQRKAEEEVERDSPTSSQLVEGPATRFFPVGPSGTRIFNPDAYCELCDREFCNKYFLKTHMANKHAVYDPNSPPEPPRGPDSMDGKRRQSGSPESSHDTRFHIAETGSQPLEAMFRSRLSLEPASSTGSERGKKERRESSPSQRSVNSIEQSEALKEQVLRQQLMQMCAQNMALQQMFNSGMSMPPFFPGLMPGLIPGMPGFFPPQALPEPMMKARQPETEIKNEAMNDVEDNKETALQCELCLKKLSSLNFLRNHLRKKHGVVENTPVKARTPSPLPVRTEMLTMDEQRRRKKEQRERRRQERKENERKSREAEVKKQENGGREESPMQRFVGMGDGMMDARMLAAMPMPFPFASGPHPKPHFSNLQRLLQVPREVFRCRECSKEFAAAVFLEQHFRNEHSKPVAPAEPAVLDLSTSKSRDRQRDPTTPSSSSSRKPKREAPNIIHPTFTFPTEEEASMGLPATTSEGNLDELCVKCNRVYCSKYFLRTHLKKSHGMSTEDYLNEVSTTHPELYQQYKARAINEEGESPSRSNWCRYCKKEFCNKYFFKTHMIKTHQENVSQFVTSNRSSKKRSNGVQCDICKKNLCSKYFLRIHQRNAHGIADPSLPNTSSPTGSLPTMSDMVQFGSESMGENDIRRSDSGEEEQEMEEDQEAINFTHRDPVIVRCGATDFTSAASPAVDMGFSESPLSSEGMKDHQEEDLSVKTTED